jgi:hypothetical protein
MMKSYESAIASLQASKHVPISTYQAHVIPAQCIHESTLALPLSRVYASHDAAYSSKYLHSNLDPCQLYSSLRQYCCAPIPPSTCARKHAAARARAPLHKHLSTHRKHTSKRAPRPLHLSHLSSPSSRAAGCLSPKRGRRATKPVK